jgi:transposase
MAATIHLAAIVYLMQLVRQTFGSGMFGMHGRIFTRRFTNYHGGGRRIASRYDKLARNFLAADSLVAALYWTKL